MSIEHAVWSLDILEQADTKAYCTDMDRDLIVKTDGKQLLFETSR